MRYYKLQIKNKDGAIPETSDGEKIGPFDTSLTPGWGLHLEFDATITAYDIVTSGTLISIYGLPITMLRQSVQLEGGKLILDAGFSAGLPLANPEQKGEIFCGEIRNAYANWQGTQQSMHFIVNPLPLKKETDQPLSIKLDGKQGEKWSDVLQRALSDAFKGFTIEIKISDELVLTEDQPGTYNRLSQLAEVLRSQASSIIKKPDYPGTEMVVQNNTIRVFDFASATTQKINPILAQELIGQPVWMELNKISFKCPLRRDLQCGDIIELPVSIHSGKNLILAVNTRESQAIHRDKISFSGQYLITSVRHLGGFLTTTGDAWTTTYEALALANKK